MQFAADSVSVSEGRIRPLPSKHLKARLSVHPITKTTLRKNIQNDGKCIKKPEWIIEPHSSTLMSNLVKRSIPTLGEKSDDINFKIEKEIVDTVIGKMLWNSEDDATYEQAMSIFKWNTIENIYEVTFAQVQHYHLAVRLVGHMLSFKATSSAIQEANEIFEVTKLKFCSKDDVSNYVMATCASALQKLSTMLWKSWTFAIALDGSVYQGISYIDVRVQFPLPGCVKDYHVIAIPFSESHTGMAMFEMIEQLFDVMCPDWKKKIIGCSIDGTANIAQAISSVVSRLANVSSDGFIRVRCLL